MKKHLKAALAAMLALIMALAAIPVSALPIITDSPTQIALDDTVQFDGDSNDHSIEQMRSISIGDYITLGNYLGEPIIWRCVDIDDNGPLMLSDRILCLKCFDANGDSDLHNDGWGWIRSSYGSNCWFDSNLRQWLNSDEISVSWSHCAPNSENTQYGTNGYSDEPGFLTFFTDTELSYIKPALHKVYINEWEINRPGYCDGGEFEAFSGGYDYLDSMSGAEFDGAYYANISDYFFMPGADQLLRTYQNLGDYVYARPTQAAVSNCEYVLSGTFDADTDYPYWSSTACNNGASYEHVMILGSESYQMYASAAYNDQIGVRPAFYLQNSSYLPDSEHSVCLATLECIDEGHYTGNQGDSRVYRLDKEPFVGYEPYGPTSTYGYNGTYRNGNILADTGEEVNNGLEVWLARWNGSPEISYAYRTFKLDGKYSLLRGSIGLVDSYNSTDFDVSLFIYGDGSMLDECSLTPENIDSAEGAIYIELYLDEETKVNELKIEMRDNSAVAGGTSFALYDLFLYDELPAESIPDVSARAFHGEFDYHSEITEFIDETYTFEHDDTWFFHNSYEYQHDLVRMSMRMALAGAWTTPDNIRKLYRILGFSEAATETHYPKPTRDSIGYAISIKNVQKDGNSISIIVCTVRGGGYLDEWANNGMVGSGSEHEGFSNAATIVLQGLSDYINNHRAVLHDDIKIWISGYSRAAAVTNIVAERIDMYGISGANIDPDDVFAFCFECPNTTVATFADNDLFDNILCFVNPIDLVPMVPPSNPLWGFRRYGKTLYYPSRSTTKNYNKYKKKMKHEYENILWYLEGDHENVSKYIKETSNQHDVLSSFLDRFAVLVSRSQYLVYQPEIMNALGEILGKEDANLADYVVLLDLLPGILGSTSIDTIPIVNSVVVSTRAHYPELSIAWLDSLEGLEDFSLIGHTGIRVNGYGDLYLNTMDKQSSRDLSTPLTIMILNSNDQIVASYEDGDILDLIDEDGVEEGIPAFIDENGQITFELPPDDEYQIRIICEDEAEFSITMTKYIGESNTPEKLVSYFDVALSAGDTCTGIVENINGNEEPYSLLVNGEEIEPSADLGEDDQIEHLVDVEVEGGGRVYFPGTFVTGEYAKLRVAFNEENFLGWYLDGELLSTAPEYRIMVTEDMLITAKFSTKLGDVNLDGNLSIADTILIARYALGLIELEAPCDLDGNRLISIADAIVSARYALGLMEP